MRFRGNENRTPIFIQSTDAITVQIITRTGYYVSNVRDVQEAKSKIWKVWVNVEGN
jgi:hypothetical protein